MQEREGGEGGGEGGGGWGGWLCFFFFNDTATTEIYTLSLHDALPISWAALASISSRLAPKPARRKRWAIKAISCSAMCSSLGNV